MYLLTLNLSFTSIFQRFCFNFKSTFTIFKEFLNDIWNDFRKTPHDGCFWLPTAKNFVQWQTFSKEAASRVINSIVLIA